MKSVIGSRQQRILRASVFELGNARVIMSTASRCTLTSGAEGVFTVVLWPQHTAAYAKDGRMIAVYINFVTSGEKPHDVPTARLHANRVEVAFSAAAAMCGVHASL